MLPRAGDSTEEFKALLVAASELEEESPSWSILKDPKVGGGCLMIVSIRIEIMIAVGECEYVRLLVSVIHFKKEKHFLSLLPPRSVAR